MAQELLPAHGTVYVMIYSPTETSLQAAARRRDLHCANGLGMLAAQGDEAFAVLTGEIPTSGSMKFVLSEYLKNKLNLSVRLPG